VEKGKVEKENKEEEEEEEEAVGRVEILGGRGNFGRNANLIEEN
jgi:hypothetical protein